MVPFVCNSADKRRIIITKGKEETWLLKVCLVLLIQPACAVEKLNAKTKGFFFFHSRFIGSRQILVVVYFLNQLYPCFCCV
jgi:hypothetical protein